MGVGRYGELVAPASGAPRALTVVLADDDDRFRSLVRSILEDDGFRILGEAADAATTRELVRAHRPDVVVLDLVMRGSDGLSTLRDLLEDDRRQSVVVLSSLFDPVVEQEVISLGAWYLEKVEGIEALEHAIALAAATVRVD